MAGLVPWAEVGDQHRAGARRRAPRARRGWPAGRTARRARRPWATAPPPACRSGSSASAPAGPSAPARPAPWTAAAAGGCRRSPAGAPSSRSGAGCASWCTSPADRAPGRWRGSSGQAHIVAQRLRLGEARQADRVAARTRSPRSRGVEVRLRQVDAGLVPAAQLEDQRLVLQQAAAAGEASARRRRRRPRAGWGGRRLAMVMRAISRSGRAARAAMSSAVVVSVAADQQHVVQAGAGIEPARTARRRGRRAAARASTTAAARRRQAHGELVEEARRQHLDARDGRQRVAQLAGAWRG